MLGVENLEKLMIEAKNLTMHYGHVVALQDASFSVEKGEILGLLGPNGAGKSTTLKILTTYLYPTSGTASVGGKDVLTEPLEVRSLVGYLPESLPLYDDMEVAEYLSFVANARNLSGSYRTERMDWVLEHCGLLPVYRRLIRELSKGFRQRTALAQALIHDPEVIVLDEPTSGLDPHQILEIRHLIKKLSRRKTVIFSTHILQEVEAVADRIVIIGRGKIVANGTLHELAEMAQEGARSEVTLNADPQVVKEKLTSLKSVQTVRRRGSNERFACFEVEGSEGQPLNEEIYQLVKENNWELVELKRKPFTLEETFLALTAEEEPTARKVGAA